MAPLFAVTKLAPCGLHDVLGTVRDAGTREHRVLYGPLHGNADAWARPHAMFFEPVVVNGRAVSRWVRLPDDLTDIDETGQSRSGQTLLHPAP